MMRRIVAVLLVTAAAATCGADAPARVRFAVFGWDDHGVPIETLVLRIEEGGRTRVVAASSFAQTDGARGARTPWLETGSEGKLTISFAVAGRAVGELVLDLRSDWGWEVQFHLTDTDPGATCFGCDGSTSYPFDGPTRLWLVWGGNSITDPVVH